MKTGEQSGRDDETPRAQLLAAAVKRAAQGGLADVSLRQFAADIGTSHRMLIYHFGSKQGLLAAVAGAVELQQRQALSALRNDPQVSSAELAATMWKRFADPSLWPLERLFFDLYVQALRGQEHLNGFLDGALEPWFALLTEMHQAHDVPARQARSLARLGVATVRGLLLDLLATEDRRGVDAAMAMFIDWYEGFLASAR